MYEKMLSSKDFLLKLCPEFGPGQCKVIASRTINANYTIPALNGRIASIKGHQKDLFDDHFSIMSFDKILYLLIGPVSFINHSCKPNLRYLKDYQLQMITVQSLCRIENGDELLVDYGETYFKYGECFCNLCLNTSLTFPSPFNDSVVKIKFPLSIEFETALNRLLALNSDESEHLCFIIIYILCT